MKQKLIQEICNLMEHHLNKTQIQILAHTLEIVFEKSAVFPSEQRESAMTIQEQNLKLIDLFLAAKRIEGCSENTVKYYKKTLTPIVNSFDKCIHHIETNDLRLYLSSYQNTRHSSKVTLDNVRRIMSTFFSWLEDEDYILKSPVRRIRKVKTTQTVKEAMSDEQLEMLRDHCTHPRDLAIIDLLVSTGIRVGELVNLNITDINFHDRECIVLGKGDKERRVYFDAKTKIHLQQYVDSRSDSNSALFVSKHAPWNRLNISGVERFLSELGKKSSVHHVHPHKFRRTMATMAIDKGMPIEQVQKLLGHSQIDTTLRYAIVNQTNVKHSHRKFVY